MHLKQVFSGCILHKVRALGSNVPHCSSRSNTWHARESSVEARVTDSTPPSLITSNSRLAMSPPILYLVTTKSSAMVCSCCSSSDIIVPALKTSLCQYVVERTAEISHATTVARRPSGSAHGLHAQRSHAHYAATTEVSSYTMAPKANRGFWIFSKKVIIVKIYD